MSGLCQLFGVTKQAYYKHHKDPYALPWEKEAEITAFCCAERQLAPAIGCRKLWMIFYREHWAVSRRVFEEAMRAYGLMLRAKRRTVRTTYSMHGLPVYPNLVYSTIPQRPCQIWVTDITYYISLKNADGTGRFCYLSIVMDAYSRSLLSDKTQ